MTTISQLRAHYNLGDDLWTAFTSVAGDPGEDARLLAALPGNVISAALERARSWTETPYLLFRPPMWDLFTIWHGECSIHEGEATGIHGGRLHPLGNRFRTIRSARWHHPQQAWKGK